MRNLPTMITRSTKIIVCLCLTAGVIPAQQEDRSGPFADIDRHADTAPRSAETSIPELAHYLTEPAASEVEKVRAIFRWVTSNIEYDWTGYKTSKYSDVRPEAVLRNKRAVCEGYAGLVEQLGKESGLEVLKVSGYAKGYGYSPGQSITEGGTNHAWNVVMIDGSWRLLDATWGAGYVSAEEDRFIRRFEEHFFLTAPEEFIYDHFPADEKWQLLDEPMSPKEYEDLAYIRPAAFAMGLRAVSHTNSMVTADGELVLTFEGPDTLAMQARLMESGYGDHPRTWTFVQRSGTSYDVRVRFPYDGYFYVRFFVRTDPSSHTLRWAGEYVVEQTREQPDHGPFPEQYNTYFDLGVTLETPAGGILHAGTTETFRISAPGAHTVAVVADSAWTHLSKEGDLFTGDVSFIGPGDATVYAKKNEQDTYHGVLKYIVEQ